MQHRVELFKSFTPGTNVRIKQHNIDVFTYDKIWLREDPLQALTAFQSPDSSVAAPGIVIAALFEIDASRNSWVLILFGDGIMGWANELEGLEILKGTNDLRS